MTHDESLYPDPYTFKPERFFDNNGELNCDDRVLAYGFGRRFRLPSLLLLSLLTPLFVEFVLDDM